MARTVAVGAALLLAACGSAGPAASPSPATATPTPAATAAAATSAACLQRSTPPPSPAAGPGPQVPALATVQFVSPRKGWAAGRGRILATADAGVTWTAQYQGPAQLTLVDFVDSRTGWAVALDGLLGTTDGGGCWRRLGEPSQPLVSVHFVDPRRGWGVSGSTAARANGLPGTVALGDGVPVQPAGGRLVVTDDGGQSWRAIATTPSDVQSVCFSDSGHGWLGAGGRLHRSTDGGAGWQPVPGLTDPGGGSSSVISLQCAAPDSAWLLDLSLQGAAGNSPYAAFVVAGGHPPVELFEDMFGGGASRPVPGSYPGPFSVISASNAAFLGQTPALPSNPVGFEEAAVAGATVSITHVGRVPGIDRAWGASFASATTGWVVADTGQEGLSVILATTDAGRTWTRQYATAP